MTEHTPDEEQVRGRYCDGTYRQTGHPTDGDEFDAWLARVRRDAKAEAWNECVRAAYTPEGRITHGPNPYETGDQA